MTHKVVRLGPDRFVVDSFVFALPAKGHDAVLAEEDFAAVADGATPLRDDWPSPREFAQRALRALADCNDPSRAGADVWTDAINTVAALRTDSGNLSAAVVVVRTLGQDIEISLLGDCRVIARTSDNTLISLTDERIRLLDQEAARLPDAASRAEQRIRNRLSMNTDDTYWIFAGDPLAARHLRVAVVKSAKLETVLLASDGLERVLDAWEGISDIEAWFENNEARSMHAVMKRVRDRVEAGQGLEVLDDDFSWILLTKAIIH